MKGRAAERETLNDELETASGEARAVRYTNIHVPSYQDLLEFRVSEGATGQVWMMEDGESVLVSSYKLPMLHIATTFACLWNVSFHRITFGSG